MAPPSIQENLKLILGVSQDINGLQSLLSQLLSTNYQAMHEQFVQLRNDNTAMVRDIVNLKENANLQAARICQLESELDDHHQYSRRENVVFTNLKAESDTHLVSQVIDLCDQLGVEVTKDDISAAHPLPARKGTRHVVRFTNRAKAQAVFKNRKHCKGLDPAKKKVIANVENKGIGVMTHLTPKRAKFYGQVTEFVKKFSYNSSWVDYNNGKIFVKCKQGERGILVTDTCDLFKLNNNFKPTDYYFCTPPIFHFGNTTSHFSPSSPPLQLPHGTQQEFSPNTPIGRGR